MLINKTKRIISIILATLFVGLFSVSISAVVFNLNNKHTEEVGVYAFSTDSSGNYLIKSKGDMEALATLVNNGNYCKGQTYKLNNDIDYQSTNMTRIGYANGRHFSGTFDGNGKTIKNFYFTETGGTISPNKNLAIFGFVWGATIKNLKVENVTIAFTGKNVTNANSYIFGGIVGTLHSGGVGGSSIIENCEALNVSIRADSYVVDRDGITYNINGKFFAGAIFGVVTGTNAKVENCKGKISDSSIYASADSDIVVAGIGSNLNSSSSSSNHTINKCYGEVGNIKYWNPNDGDYIKIREIGWPLPYQNYNAVVSTVVDYSSTSDSVGKIFMNVTNSYSAKNNKLQSNYNGAYTNLGANSTASGTSGWYYNSYYDDEPYLKLFMKWKTYAFLVSPSEAATLSQSSLSVPDDVIIRTFGWGVEYMDELYIDLTNNNPDLYTFDKWEKSGTTYTAKFNVSSQPIVYELNGGENHASNPSTYNPATGAVISGAPTKSGWVFVGWSTDNNVNNAVTSYTIAAGTIGTVTLYAHWRLPTYTVTFNANTSTNQTTQTQWTDIVKGTTISYTFTNRRAETNSIIAFSGADNDITYVANSGYTICSTTIAGNTYISSNSFTVNANVTISVTTGQFVTVTMANAVIEGDNPLSSSGVTSPAAKTGDGTMKVIKGESINATRSGKDIVYGYSNGSNTYTTTYTGAKYFAVDTSTATGAITINNTQTITPKYVFSACYVTFTLSGEGSLTVNNSATDAYVTGSGKTRSFVVEYGTELTITPTVTSNRNADSYIYSFKTTGTEVVKITIARTDNTYYLSDDGVENDGSHTFATGTTSLEITPVISIKTYDVGVG